MSEQMKTDPKKVVQLNPERNTSTQAPIVLTRMPAAMHTLRDKARQQLQTMLRELFDKVDDAMFELADKANSNHDQNLYFDSMREVRIRRRTMEASFFRSIDIKFAQLFDHNAYRDEQQKEEKPFSLDELSLVKNDELEEMVATEGMINKANEQFAELIQHLTLRIDHLVPVKVYQKNNPIGADVICHAFTDSTQSLNIDVKAKLVLFKLFDNLVMSKLGKLFESLNQTLIDANILPSLKQELRPKRPSQPQAPSNHYGAGIGSGMASTGSVGSTAGYDDQTNQVLHTLRDLLGSTSRTHAQPAEVGEEISSRDLLKALSLAQHQNMPVASVSAPVNLRSLLSELLASSADQKPAAINQVDDDVINLVSMMFEFILDDRNLAAPMKALIGRLQIPMVKVAIADKTFFSKGGHPARRLLNEMAMACLGWQETAEDSQRKDGLYEKMQETVSTILCDFETDMSIFERLLVDFRSYLEKEKRRAQILEQRTIDAEDGKAKSERARAQVDAELNRICRGHDIPVAASKMLREAWANVMFITCLKQGVGSQEWKDRCVTAHQLVWSVTAAMDKDNRQRLLKLVPDLLQKLRTGLESISFSPFETTQLFKQLETIHLARLRGGEVAKPAIADTKPLTTAPKPEVSAAEPLLAPVTESVQQEVNAGVSAPVSEPVVIPLAIDPESAIPVPAPLADVAANEEQASAVPETFIVVNDVEQDAQSTESTQVSTSAQIDAQHLALVSNITQGTWFEMQGEGGEKYRCRLAAVIRSVGKYIFVNRAGMKVAEESRESLALALQTKRLTILDDGMLFDRALESVISSLRDKRSSN